MASDLRLILLAASLLITGTVLAAETVNNATTTRIKGALAQVMPGSPDSINTTPMPGIYEVAYGAQVLYVSEKSDRSHVVL